MCENWGYERLWKKIREESIGEMKHADELIERILYLEGVPNVQRLGKVNVGETVPEQLRLDLELERDAIRVLNAGIETARSLGDNGTRELLEHILEGEEEPRELDRSPDDLDRADGRRQLPRAADQERGRVAPSAVAPAPA